MKSFFASIVVVMLGAFLAGCQSNVGIGDGLVASPDRSFALEVTSFAHYRYDYFDKYETPKEFQVNLTRTGRCLFCHSYSVMGWDVSWETRWMSETDVSIDIFDFGSSFDHRTSKTSDAPKRLLGKIELHIDPVNDEVRSSGFMPKSRDRP